MSIEQTEKERILYDLTERAKELKCIYSVEEILKDFSSPLEDVFNRILDAIPPGWQFPELCFGEIIYDERRYVDDKFKDSFFRQTDDLIIDGTKRGEIRVYYDDSPIYAAKLFFLSEEFKLLNTIARKISDHIFNRKLKQTFSFWDKEKRTFDALSEKEGKLIQILTNYDIDYAIKLLNNPARFVYSADDNTNDSGEYHWSWRMRIADSLVEKIGTSDVALSKFGIVKMAVIGSVAEKNVEAKDDIDILVHFRGEDCHRERLLAWIDGWSNAIGEMYFQKSGIYLNNFIDLHFVLDEDLSSLSPLSKYLINNESGMIPLDFIT